MDKIRTCMTLHMAVMQTAIRAGGTGAGMDLNPLGIGSAYTLLARTLNRLVAAPAGPGQKPKLGPVLSSVGSAQCVSVVLCLLLDIGGWALSQARAPGVGHQAVKAMEALHKVGLALLQSVGPAVLSFPELNALLGLLEEVHPGTGRRSFNPNKVMSNRPPQLRTRAELEANSA
jgi:hypothetical protein